MPLQIQVIVTGIFQTNAKDFDDIYSFTNEEIGRKLFHSPLNAASSIDIKLKNIDDVLIVKDEIKNIIPLDTQILSWYDLHKQLYDIMNFERTIAFIIMSLIIIIAVFNVLASLTMTVVEKKRDIGILKTLGATEKGIRNIFVLQGSMIGIISTFLGILLGVGFCLGQIQFGWFRLDSSNFLISAIPVSIKITDVVIITIFSLILSFLATIYPAKRAAKTLAIDSIRGE
jgi:lipoprotein-releasing system permease protein